MCHQDSGHKVEWNCCFQLPPPPPPSQKDQSQGKNSFEYDPGWACNIDIYIYVWKKYQHSWHFKSHWFDFITMRRMISICIRLLIDISNRMITPLLYFYNSLAVNVNVPLPGLNLMCKPYLDNKVIFNRAPYSYFGFLLIFGGYQSSNLSQQSRVMAAGDAILSQTERQKDGEQERKKFRKKIKITREEPSQMTEAVIDRNQFPFSFFVFSMSLKDK